MEKTRFDIHKSGGILIQDKKLLVEKSFNKGFYIAPGGSIEEGETTTQALVRELSEEFQIITKEEDFEEFGIFYAEAAGQEDLVVRMDVFIVKRWKGEPKADSEVEDVRWIDSSGPSEIPVGSIFEHEVIPRLKAQELID